MPPKKRGRKPKPKPDLVVPPKKRKQNLEIDPEDFEYEKKLIPEWLKLSIQILLINFHHEGVALLNSIQSEYTAVYKDIKVDPTDYDFKDWESMLKSPQFKQHCFVYTDKKMPCVKGYPLLRSAVINIRHNRWEITPQISPFQDKDVDKATQTHRTIFADVQVETNMVDSHCQTNSSKLIEIEEPASESVSESVPAVLAIKIPNIDDMMIGPKTPEETEISSPEPFEMPKLTSINSPPGIETEMHDDQNISKNINDIDTENSKLNESPKEYRYYPSGRRRRHGSFDQSNFFRRSDVPETWTRVEEDEAMKELDESRKFPISKNIVNTSIEDYTIEDMELAIDESSNTPRYSAYSPEPTCPTRSPSLSLSPSPPPPHLDPVEIFQGHRNKKNLSPSSKLKSNSRSPKKRYLSRKRAESTEKSVRRISESTDSNSNNENSNSPKSTSSPTDDLEEEQTGRKNKIPLVESFSKWRFIPFLTPEPDLSPSHSMTLAEMTNMDKAKLGIGMHPDTKIHRDRDPRLNPETTTSRYFNVETTVGAEAKVGVVGHDPRRKSRFSDSDGGNIRENQESINRPCQHQGLSRFNFGSIITPDKSTLIGYPMPNMQPNLKITITQQPTLENLRKITHSAISLKRFNETNAIPQDNFNYKNLRFADLWNDTKWKSRFDHDAVPPNRFFKSNIFERWREAWRINLSDNRMEYVKELQIYDDKPYPARCEFFLRSALRMVEIDYLTDYQFSEPRTLEGENLVGLDEVLYYVDFAGAPGGSIEFYNKRRRWASKGFGITYQKRSYDLYAIPEAIPEYFEPFYGKLNSLNGDGSLFCGETVQLFINRVMDVTNGKGVHVVTTVGNVARITFDDDNDEKWKYQHLAQIMVAMMVLKEGGNMAFKMYDIKSSFVAGLLYILYRSFKYVQISKLHIFAPGSAERVVICIGKRPEDEVCEIIKFLQECHKVMAEWYIRDKFSKNKRTIEELIPLSTMEKSAEFMNYLRDSNERLKRTQLEEFLMSMKNLRTVGSIFSKGTYRALIAKTTELWNIGERPSYVPKSQKHPVSAFKELEVYPEDVCEAVETILNEYNLYTIFASAQQWRFSPVGNQSRSRGFYLGVDGIPHFFNMKFKEWLPVRDYEFRLPSRTLVYGEIISIFTDENKEYGEELFSIIDGIELAGQDIRNLPYPQRIRECEKFGTAVTKAFFPRMTKFTVTRSFDFSLLPQFLKKIESSLRPKYAFGGNNTEATNTKTLILSADTVFSNGCIKNGKQGWFNPAGVLFFESDNHKATDFCASLFSRVYWEWVPEMDLPLPKAVLNASGDGEQTLMSLDPSSLLNPNLDDDSPIGSVSARKIIDFVNRYS